MGTTRKPTFSCRRCFNNFSSRYVLFDKTGVENGFMIFLIATDVPDNWSFAELPIRLVAWEEACQLTRPIRKHPYRRVGGRHIEW